jgi:hypothetical protein
LFATRAFESPHTEGGFLVLKDIAVRAVDDKNIYPAFLSTGSDRLSKEGVRLLHGMTGTGWSLPIAMQYTLTLASIKAKVDLVHTAHVPTALNSRLLGYLRSRGNAHGIRYVQTVTALPKSERIRSELFWGDAVACINPELSSIVAKYRENVRTIFPMPLPERLANRQRMPTRVLAQLSSGKLVCCPIVASRLDPKFPLEAICRGILNQHERIKLVFACRFGEERMVRRWLSPLSRSHWERITFVGTVDWILDLFSLSDVVLYPISDLTKKFNPPLALLEAAQLGTGVVTSPDVYLGGLLDESALISVSGNDPASWVSAVGAMLESSGGTRGLSSSFEDSYKSYKHLYDELLEGK